MNMQTQNTMPVFGLWMNWSVAGELVISQEKASISILKKSKEMKTTTGMNGSGIGVKDIIKHWNVSLEDLYIILDDVDLPLGKLRIRPKGGDGCHRGMESVIYHLGSTRFPRLRYGIATEDKLRPAEKYVLKSFRKKDQVLADEMVVKTADAVESILRIGISKTMNKYNS